MNGRKGPCTLSIVAISTIAIILNAVDALPTQSYVNYEVTAGEDAFARIILSKKLSSLATIPFCYSVPTNSSKFEPTVKSNISWSDYIAMMDGLDQAPLQMTLLLQIIQLAELNEKDQSLTLVVSLTTLWNDCRLRWSAAESTASMIYIKPQKFKDVEVFSPRIRILENLNPRSTRNSETAVKISKNGKVHLSSDFSLSISCNIDVSLFPFDIQVCYITFESVLEEIVVHFSYNESTVEIESDYLLGRYMPNDEWALTVLPPTRERRFTCRDKEVNESDAACMNDALKYKLILRRHPNYDLINLLLPAFLTVVISSFVFAVPPDGGEKIEMSFTILLSFYMFSVLMYQKMPETGSVVPLLSQYFLVCIVLVSLSCLYSIASAVLAAANNVVPSCFQKMVLKVGPYFMYDLILTKEPTLNTTNAGQPDANGSEIELEEINNRNTALTIPSDNKGNNNNIGNGAQSQKGSEKGGKKFEGFQLDGSEDISWAAVGALLDRFFLIVHLIASFTLLAVYLIKGYMPWTAYAILNMDERTRNYTCYQKYYDLDEHKDLKCSEYFESYDYSD